jgi:hypothetical protein
MSQSFARPTEELRQIKRPIKQGNGVCGPGYYETTTGYDVTVQRKWMIYVKVKDGCAAQWETPTEEWRDLPTVVKS